MLLARSIGDAAKKMNLFLGQHPLLVHSKKNTRFSGNCEAQRLAECSLWSKKQFCLRPRMSEF
jgi:hypothetical protein